MLPAHTFISFHGRNRVEARKAAEAYNQVIRNMGKESEVKAVYRYGVTGTHPRTGYKYMQYYVSVIRNDAKGES